jgi:hypothetical protein
VDELKRQRTIFGIDDASETPVRLKIAR